MATSLNVQRAARRLGVSPVTIRRWTASGFLPCTRTPGGHRRFRQEDVDELAQLIRGSNPLAARLARERELETLLATSIALVSRLELPDLLKEIAKQLTRLMDCHFCAISALDEQTQIVTMLADYDDSGRRLPDVERYHLSRFPLTRRVLEERIPAVVNVSDPAADPDELHELLREGDKSLLMVPLVYGGRSTGLLELIDHRRERRYSPQELRLCTAIAGQAAVAIHNAEAFSAARRKERDIETLRRAIAEVSRGTARLEDITEIDAALREVAEVACRICDGASCVAERAGRSSGVARRDLGLGQGKPRQELSGSPSVISGAQLVVVSDPNRPSGVTLTLTLAREARSGETELLGLWAAIAGYSLSRLAAAGDGPIGPTET